MAINSNGSINTVTTGTTVIVPRTTDSVSIYAEALSVPSGEETEIVTYTAPPTGLAYLQFVSASGTNIGIFRVYQASSVIEKRYTYFTVFSVDLDFETDDGFSPGILIPASTTVSVTILQNRPLAGDFNARIQILEIP